MRARNIKPGFFENEELAELPYEARLLYIGLWCISDREGRFEWRPKRIKALIFPYDDVDVESHLMSLHVMTLILQYKTEDSLYGYIPNFKKHQNPHPHEAKSILPDPFGAGTLIMKAEKEHLATNQNDDSIQCHDMSLKCNADILIPDSLIPDSKNTLSGNSSDDDFEPSTVKAKDRIPFNVIINHLNTKTGKSFRPNTNKTRKMITARWNEGWREEQFFAVIDIKCEKWLTDPSMMDYLRPETLFGTKFESYLNEANCKPAHNGNGNRKDDMDDWAKRTEERYKREGRTWVE